jgi:hypothetical protein
MGKIGVIAILICIVFAAYFYADSKSDVTEVTEESTGETPKETKRKSSNPAEETRNQVPLSDEIPNSLLTLSEDELTRLKEKNPTGFIELTREQVFSDASTEEEKITLMNGLAEIPDVHEARYNLYMDYLKLHVHEDSSTTSAAVQGLVQITQERPELIHEIRESITNLKSTVFLDAFQLGVKNIEATRPAP